MSCWQLEMALMFKNLASDSLIVADRQAEGKCFIRYICWPAAENCIDFTDMLFIKKIQNRYPHSNLKHILPVGSCSMKCWSTYRMRLLLTWIKVLVESINANLSSHDKVSHHFLKVQWVISPARWTLGLLNKHCHTLRHIYPIQ